MTNYHNYRTQLKIAAIDNGIEYLQEGTGAPLIFLHGALSNGYTWRKIIPQLSQKFCCIVPHLPFGGHSIPLSNSIDLSPTGIAELLYRFMKRLGIEKAVLVANDTGGAYTQVFASMYPEMVKGMVLSNCEVLDVFPPPAFAYLTYAVKIPSFTFLMSSLFRITPLLNKPLVMGALSQTLTAKELADGYLKNFIRNAEIRKNFAELCQHWHPKHTLKAASILKDFQKPVLVLWGNKDTKLFPKTQMQKLLNVFPNVEWQEIAHSKTYIQEDAPIQTAKEIERFLSLIG